MTNTTTDTKQGQPLTVSENKTAQNVQNKGTKMKKLDRVNLKNNENIQVQIGKDSYVEIVKLDSGSVMVEINHYNTSAVKKVKLNNFVDFRSVDETSWSQCETSFNEEETRVNVQHTAFNK